MNLVTIFVLNPFLVCSPTYEYGEYGAEPDGWVPEHVGVHHEQVAAGQEVETIVV